MVSAPVTASRTRQRLEHVFNWAITSGHRVDNPAGKHILSALPMSTRETNHHESLPYGDVPLAYATVGACECQRVQQGRVAIPNSHHRPDKPKQPGSIGVRLIGSRRSGQCQPRE